jgi:hypothetical protein
MVLLLFFKKLKWREKNIGVFVEKLKSRFG